MIPRQFEAVIPVITEYLHFVDACELSKSNSIVRARIAKTLQLNHFFNSLAIHGLDSSDHPLDLSFSDFVVRADPKAVESLLFGSGDDRFKSADQLMVFNFEEAEPLLKNVLLRISSLTTLKLFNVPSLSIPLVNCKNLVSLKIGLNTGSLAMLAEPLALPNLRTLDITGFPVGPDPDSAETRWLLGSLAGVTAIKWLRVNCVYSDQVIPLSVADYLTAPAGPPTPDINELKWTNSNLYFLEIVLANFEGINKPFQAFTDRIFQAATSEAFPEVHTVTLNCSPSHRIMSSLSLSPNIIHLVLTNCDGIDLKQFGPFLRLNCTHLQILVLKFAGRSNAHLDSIAQLILNSANLVKRTSKAPLPPLERLELEVVMHKATTVMEMPYHTVRAMTALRCRYRDNMYFKRSKFGVSMACQRFLCVDSEPPPSIASPMELFCEEMVRGMYDSEDQSSPSVEASMITDWNGIGQVHRGIYVDIFDDFVERELRFGDSDPPVGGGEMGDCSADSKAAAYCDVSATIAHLRE